jgi:hypothetical protein
VGNGGAALSVLLLAFVPTAPGSPTAPPWWFFFSLPYCDGGNRHCGFWWEHRAGPLAGMLSKETGEGVAGAHDFLANNTLALQKNPAAGALRG